MLMRLQMCILVFVFTVFAAPSETSKLSGTVTDPEGGVISGAYIFVHWDPVALTSNVGIKADLRVQTDKDGTYSIDLPPGFYDVFVSAMSFTPSCHKVRIRAEQATVLNPKLKVDRVVSKELGG